MPCGSPMPVKIESEAPKWPRFAERVLVKSTPLFAIFIRLGTLAGDPMVSRLRTPPANATTMTRSVLYLPRRGMRAREASADAGSAAAPAATPAVFRNPLRVIASLVMLVLRARQDRVQ